jgi:hypothetical protein
VDTSRPAPEQVLALADAPKVPGSVVVAERSIVVLST